MLNKLLLSFLAMTVAVVKLTAQDSTHLKNQIALEYGFHYLADQDLIFSPFVLKDIAPMNISTSYVHKGKFIQMAEIYFDSFNPTYKNTFTYYTNPDSSALETIPNDFTFVKINYGFGKMIRATEKYDFIVGGMSENTVIAKYYYAGYFSTFGYFASFSLSPWATYNYYFNKQNTLQFAIHFPIAAWVCRSPYLANDDQFIENISSHKSVKTFFAYVNDGNLQTLNKLQQFDIEASYIYAINKRFDTSISYHFNYIHNSTPLPYSSVQHSFNIQTSFKF